MPGKSNEDSEGFPNCSRNKPEVILCYLEYSKLSKIFATFYNFYDGDKNK